MKIILNCGDKINIPEGCKAEIKDGVITIEKKPKFKDGDIFFNDGVIGIYRNGGGDRIFYHCALMDVRLFLGENKPSYFGWDEDARFATEEEKHRLFDVLKLNNLCWNAEEKKVEKIRWRVEKESFYYFFTTAFDVAKAEEDGKEVANHRYAAYNYFRTKEQAEKAAELVKDTLKKFHEDYGSNK
ncbi:hypothetical protein [Hoylesella shahii]|uniref:hypothetical protein n=1 Tax=Hoylesella shahii TaxID=228603 RepID=UPI0028898DAC|nr:hypothetical protein [Hoylesella shahii]